MRGRGDMRKKVRLYKAKDMEWQQPIQRGYLLGCCDCNLIHRVNFRVLNPKTGKLVRGLKIQFQAERCRNLTKKFRGGRHVKLAG